MLGRPWVSRLVWAATAVLLVASLLGVLAFVVGTFGVRLPYWGEAEVVFEASRLRAGFPLFIDPRVGGAELGLPPSRFYVTYPPLLATALRVVPSSACLSVARGLSSVAWFGALAWLAGTARPGCRTNAVAGATLVAGIWIIANFAMTGRPDSVACGLAAVGLGRSIRRGNIDLPSLVCLVLVPFVKPTIIGLPVGAIVADAIVRRRPGVLVRAAALAFAVLAVLEIATRGQLLDHVIASNAQPLSFSLWLESVPGRLPFFLPLFLVAFWHGVVRLNEPGVAIGLGALGAAFGWMLIAIAKTGSAANYWMEPCIAAIALLAQASGPFVFGKSGLLHAAVALASVGYTTVASIPASLRHIESYRREATALASVRAICGAGPDAVIASDEQGIELALNGRILTPAYQMAWLVRRGRYPAEIWTRDLADAHVRCFVVHSHALRVAPAVAEAVETLFEPVRVVGGLDIRRRR